MTISDVALSASTTPKSSLIENIANTRPTYSLKVTCLKEKAQLSPHKMQPNERGESWWILGTFHCNSLFCGDVYSTYSFDFASVYDTGKSKHFKRTVETRVRGGQRHLLNLHISKWQDIENWLILGMSCCTSSKDPKEIR